MKYRLVALDLDGTLLDSWLQVRRETIEALASVRAQGVQVMVVTGHHHVAAYPYWHQLGLELPAICCNGAYLYDYRTQRALDGTPLAWQEARDLLRLVRKHGIFSMAYETRNEHLRNLLAWSAALADEVRPRIEQVASFEQLIEDAGTLWKFTAAGDDRPATTGWISRIPATARAVGWPNGSPGRA